MSATRDRRTWVCIIHGCLFGYAGKTHRCGRCGLSPEESVQARSATGEILKRRRATKTVEQWKEGQCLQRRSMPNTSAPATGSESGMGW